MSKPIRFDDFTKGEKKKIVSFARKVLGYKEPMIEGYYCKNPFQRTCDVEIEISDLVTEKCCDISITVFLDDRRRSYCHY